MSQSPAQAHRRAEKRRTIRLAKSANARTTIGTLERESDIYCLTFGQFSLIDAITVVLEQIGPADVVISTWTAANADLTYTERMIERAEIRSLRFIVDRSFQTRQPAYCARMREIFGDECIRTARSHAKFVLLRNDEWHVVIRTSMNLNENPRLESIEISDSRALSDFLWRVVDEIYDEQEAGIFASELPALAGIPSVDGTSVTAAPIDTTGMREVSVTRTAPATP